MEEISGEIKADVTIDDLIEDSGNQIEEIKLERADTHPESAIYTGNVYDITSLIAVLSGICILFLCLTCNMGFYVIPFVAIILGIIGVVMAKKSINPQRTELLSWLGIGSGLAFILISLIGIALYIILIILLIRGSGY